MTRVMLIAGVAALAIATPAAAGLHGHGDHGGGNGGGHASAMPRGNRGGGGGGGFKMQAPRAQHAPMQRMNFAQRGHDRGGMQMQRQAMQRQRGVERQAMQRQRNVERQAMQHQRGAERQAMQRQRGNERQAMQRQRNNQRQAMVQQRNQRQAMQQRHAMIQQRQAMQRQHNQQQQARVFAQQQRQQQARADQMQVRSRMVANHMADRRQMAENRMAQAQMQRQRAQFARLPQRQFAANFTPRYRDYGRRGMIAPDQAMRLVGAPVSRASSYYRLAELPRSVRYLYPDTPDTYYRYGDGYIYQVDRRNDIIDSLLPLVAGGFVPGMTFPTAYMSSYVPAAYGMDSFYPDTPYADYRYLDGNVYSVDPYSGAIEDVIPTYAYGYGVGQMLPAGYGYYNVPAQYRTMYYDTADYQYRYAPGAIYQVDPGSQMITGVASLLAPGLAVGQPLPAGYGMYNVPMAYRSTYYDTPNAWYRYNNGYIYQVDPTTQLVTAVVRSLLA